MLLSSFDDATERFCVVVMDMLRVVRLVVRLLVLGGARFPLVRFGFSFSEVVVTWTVGCAVSTLAVLLVSSSAAAAVVESGSAWITLSGSLFVESLLGELLLFLK